MHDWQVVVENLPPGTSWQDLKDFMRKAGDVGFSEITRDGSCVHPHMREASVPCACVVCVCVDDVPEFEPGVSVY